MDRVIKRKRFSKFDMDTIESIEADASVFL